MTIPLVQVPGAPLPPGGGGVWRGGRAALPGRLHGDEEEAGALPARHREAAADPAVRAGAEG